MKYAVVICTGLLTGTAAWAADLAESPMGDYHVVTLRRAIDVAGPPEDKTAEGALGQVVSFGRGLKWWDGTTCGNWNLAPADAPVANLQDPYLSDTQIGPNDGENSKGDQRYNDHWTLRCGDKAVAPLVRVDDRILISPSRSGLTYIVMERALGGKAVKAFQTELKSMKFFEGTPSETWSEESLAAVSAYAEYRGADFRFLRTAITENLLDGLKVPAQ